MRGRATCKISGQHGIGPDVQDRANHQNLDRQHHANRDAQAPEFLPRRPTQQPHQRRNEYDGQDDLDDVHREKHPSANAQPQWNRDPWGGEFQRCLDQGNADDQAQPNRRQEKQ